MASQLSSVNDTLPDHESQAEGTNMHISSAEENKPKTLSHDESKITMDLIENPAGVLQNMTVGPLNIEVNESQAQILSAQADLWESVFQRSGIAECIEKAVEYRSLALSLTPDGHEERSYRLGSLGTTLLWKFERFGDLADLNQAIQYMSEALPQTPEGNANRLSLLNSLGTSFMRRFISHSEHADMDQAIQCFTKVVQLTPNGDPAKPDWIHNLGVSYSIRSQCLGDLTDMEKAIQCSIEAIQLTHDGHPRKPGLLDSLGSSYEGRFRFLGELADLDRGIECKSEAVRLTLDGDPGKPMLLNNLGGSYTRRFERLGKLADIDQAIHYGTQAVPLTPEGHPDKPRHINNLGCSYMRRFERLGELKDIDQAIHYGTQAVQLTPDGHTDKPTWFSNLGNSHMRRFEHLGELADLEHAIQSHTQAARPIPDSHPNKPGWLNNLGSSHASRFERFGERSDADQAIECQTRAVQLTPDGNPYKLTRLSNLASSYLRRFDRLDELADVDQAIQCLTQALQLTPDGHPHKLGLLRNLGQSHECRYKHSTQDIDHECAHSAFQQAAQLVLTHPETQLACARKWAEYCLLLGLSPQKAYERCMELLPYHIWLGTTIDRRYSLLTSVSDLATEAASWAISVQSYDLAIEWLEEGRSIVWNQVLQLRMPFDELSTVDPELAQRLKHIASQLESAGLRDNQTTLESDLETVAQAHRHLAADWETFLEQARSIPGFDHFMRPRKAAQLKTAATDGPVALINSHSTRWDALIIFPQCDEVIHIPLPPKNVNEPLEQLFSGFAARHGGERARGLKLVNKRAKPEDPFQTMLADLWLVIVRPILDALACAPKMSLDELPHVTWCATGVLAFLPLHAAGPYDNSSPNAFDLVISSYTPTLSALRASNDLPSEQDTGVLAVGQEFTKDLSPLPYTVQELEAVQALVKATLFQQLDGENATVNAVLNAMTEHNWVHLACHAVQDPVNPAHSAFHLHDGKLTLETINKQQFTNKGLAFLSACQTAKGDGKLPDEAVHLAAGMLMAGYPSVIATMWSIADIDGPEVAGRVYAELLKDGRMDHRGAAMALHKAVGELRGKIGVGCFERWVPFIHIGA